MSCDDLKTITSHTGQAWRDVLSCVYIDPDTEQELGPLSLVGRTVTGTLTLPDGSTIAVTSPATGITILSPPLAGQFALDLTWAQIATMTAGTQVTFDFTVWEADHTEVLSAPLIYLVRSG